MAITDNKAVASEALATSHRLYDAQPHSHLLGGQARFEELFGQFAYGEETCVHRLTVEKGVVTREDVDCARLVHERNGNQAELTVFFLPCPPRSQVALTAPAFAHLFEACGAPPSYLEILANNNGVYDGYSLKGPAGSPGHYYLLVKFPFSPFSNGSLFMHHSMANGRTTCIITSTRAQILAKRFFDAFHFPTTTAKPSSPHPFVPLAMLLEHFRITNDEDRDHIDQAVCRIENRSGVSLHTFGSRMRAKIGEYALLQRELHMQDALIVMAEHCFSFHAQFAEFVIEEERKFSERWISGKGATAGAGQAYVPANLGLNASMSTWTLKQLHALEKRLKVQLRVIDSTISATDALTMIQLARASHSDSSTMKAITILTMIFLPATFVCSLFGMGFFDFGADNNTQLGPRRMHVAGQFWVYFAVAVPLTVVVLGVCAAWLRWSERRGEEDGEGAGGQGRKAG